MSNADTQQSRSTDDYDPTIDAIFEESTWSDLLQDAPSFLISMFFHLVVMLVLMAIPLLGQSDNRREIVSGPGDSDEITDLDDIFNDISEEINPIISDNEGFMDAEHVNLDVEAIGMYDDPHADSLQSFISSSISDPNAFSGFVNAPGAYSTDGLVGRGQKAKGLRNGGNEGSERAVARALNWMAEHQRPDGSWSYDLKKCPNCLGKCSESGANTSVNSATALAIMPFLAAGITHKKNSEEKLSSDYHKVVANGLNYLLKNAERTPAGYSFIDQESYGLYHHGICTIVICEAYAMAEARDKKMFGDVAKGAVQFIVNAQDPVGGGWRYKPKQAGDTSAVGWQWMALKSAEMGYIPIPNNGDVHSRAVSFLDNVVGYDGGAGYGYTDSSSRGEGAKATSAIGLLCRMYAGWRLDNPALQRGVATISNRGPKMNNVYYNYYATQVMHQYGGEAWDKWNVQMRDTLIKTQSSEGHEVGSWWPEGGDESNHGQGGRLYYTSMSTMILEVYYRYMPLFKQLSTEEIIPLD